MPNEKGLEMYLYHWWSCCSMCRGFLCEGLSQYEKRLDSLPLHKLKEKLSDTQEDKEKTVLTIPKDMPMLERLRVCRHVLHGNVGNRDACK